MKTNELKQEHIDLYVANTEEFWTCFYNSLDAPFHPWHDDRSSIRNASDLISFCGSNNDVVLHLSQILFQFPLLKGEYFLGWAVAMILTNYRLILNDKNTGLHNIPLAAIKFYGEREYGKTDSEKKTQKAVEYSLNNKSIIINWISIAPEHVNYAVARGEFNELNKAQKLLLVSSFYTLRKNPNIQVPVITWESSLFFSENYLGQ